MEPSPRDVVNEFIHETYLETLDDAALVRDLEDFSETCGRIISRSIEDGSKILELNQRLSSIRESQLRGDVVEPEWAAASDGIRRARRIVENKKRILRAIEEVAPEAALRIRAAVEPRSERRQLMEATAVGAVRSAIERGEAAPVTRTQLYGAVALLGIFFAVALVLL